MKLTLEGPEVEEYQRLVKLDKALGAIAASVGALATGVQQLITFVQDFSQRMEADLSELSTQLNAKLDELQAQVAAARDKVVSTVEAESQEDREQNARLAEAQAEIDRLRRELEGGVSAADAEAIAARIADLSRQVVDLAGQVKVTDPSSPAPEPPTG